MKLTRNEISIISMALRTRSEYCKNEIKSVQENINYSIKHGLSTQVGDTTLEKIKKQWEEELPKIKALQEKLYYIETED